MKKRLAALLLGTVAGLLLCELATRLLSDRLLGLSHPAVRFDPELGWVQREGESGMRRNEAGQEVAIVGSALGIRQPPRPYESQGRETVLVVGDSFTAGTQLRFEDTWTAQLESLLRSRHPTVQVVNAGVDRYDLSQSYRMAARLIDRFHPRHLVVAVYLGNDVIDYERDGQGRDASWLARHSYFLHFVRGALSKRGHASAEDEAKAPSVVEGWSPSSVPEFAELRPDQQARIRGQFAAGDVLPVWRGGEEGERRLGSTRRQIEAFGRLASAARARLTVVLLPMKQEVIPEQRAELLALHHLKDDDVERLHRVLTADASVDSVDVTPALRAQPEASKLFWIVDLHMTARGHARVAEAVAERIERAWGTLPSAR